MASSRDFTRGCQKRKRDEGVSDGPEHTASLSSDDEDGGVQLPRCLSPRTPAAEHARRASESLTHQFRLPEQGDGGVKLPDGDASRAEGTPMDDVDDERGLDSLMQMSVDPESDATRRAHPGFLAQRNQEASNALRRGPEQGAPKGNAPTAAKARKLRRKAKQNAAKKCGHGEQPEPEANDEDADEGELVESRPKKKPKTSQSDAQATQKQSETDIPAAKKKKSAYCSNCGKYHKTPCRYCSRCQTLHSRDVACRVPAAQPNQAAPQSVGSFRPPVWGFNPLHLMDRPQTVEERREFFRGVSNYVGPGGYAHFADSLNHADDPRYFGPPQAQPPPERRNDTRRD